MGEKNKTIENEKKYIKDITSYQAKMSMMT